MQAVRAARRATPRCPAPGPPRTHPAGSSNPGNSGGPLINAQGQVVGINTAIFSQSGGSIGIGFAIPINLAKGVVTQLADNGHVDRGWLGVAIQPVTPDLAKSFTLPAAAGALVSSVTDGSPAEKAGVKRGDVITEYNGRKVARSEDLPRAVADTMAGRTVPLTLVRGGKTVTLSVTIAQLADRDARPAAPGEAPAPSMGLSVQTLTPALAQQLGAREPRGVVVRGVKDGSPAANAGLRPGDVIVETDHKAVASVDQLKGALDRHAKGTPVLFLVHREGASLYVAVTA